MRLRPRPRNLERAPATRERERYGIDDGPSVPSMVRIVAVTVTLIILVSFAAGYGFGRLFL